MNMSNKTYDTLKWIAMYLLPALGTLYFALAGIWNFPCGEQFLFFFIFHFDHLHSRLDSTNGDGHLRTEKNKRKCI